MDQQNTNGNKRVPTEAEIARLEAEAVAALRRGETPAAKEPEAGPEVAAPAQDGFVPYVDDVPEPEAAPEADEDDDEYIPGPWEKRIDALTPGQWKRWQIGGGALTGLAAIAALFLFGEELSAYGIIVAALLALLLPRYLERAWRRKLTTARYAMVVAMIVGLAIMAARVLLRTRGAA